jgi:hypothetical protein
MTLQAEIMSESEAKIKIKPKIKPKLKVAPEQPPLTPTPTLTLTLTPTLTLEPPALEPPAPRTRVELKIKPQPSAIHRTINLYISVNDLQRGMNVQLDDKLGQIYGSDEDLCNIFTLHQKLGERGSSVVELLSYHQ